ncbi:MAG: hypothetical protein D6775_01525 [Caldilineae bacterium]|nr:MAG: hypothetical protein D6775_01525 [Caldilineae bacterium]
MRDARVLPVLLALVLLLGFPTACSRGARTEALPDYQLQLRVLPHPPQVGESTLILSLTDAEGRPVSGARLEIKGDMSHAGMQPVLTEALPGDPGTYKALITWSMAGDWIVTITVKLPDGRRFRRRFDLTVVGG